MKSASIGVVLLLLAGASPARAQDSLTVLADAGVGTDITNQILYEQEFDSTAFTRRLTTNEGEIRILGLARAQLLGLHDRTSYAIGTDLRAGPLLFRNLARAGVGQVVSRRLRVSLDAEHDYRRDTSFDQRREDSRVGTLLAGRWFDVRSGWGGRLFHRFEAQRSAAGAVELFPAFDYQALGIDVDRLIGIGGSASLSYSYAWRAFPDTSVRNYHEHDAGLSALARLSDSFSLDLWGDFARRRAEQDSAFGDRFHQGDLEARLTAHGEGPFEGGLGIRVRATRYDEPTTSFFDSHFYRYGAFVRHRPNPTTVLEARPEIEFGRTPDFGRLPGSASVEDKLTVAGEEFDQLSLAAEIERFTPRSWTTLGLVVGSRNFLLAAGSPQDLSAHSDYWFVEVLGTCDVRFASRLRLIVSADWLSEFHTLDFDDVHSLFLAAEIRTRL